MPNNEDNLKKNSFDWHPARQSPQPVKKVHKLDSKILVYEHINGYGKDLIVLSNQSVSSKGHTYTIRKITDSNSDRPIVELDNTDPTKNNDRTYLERIQPVLRPLEEFLDIDEITDIMSASEIVDVRFSEEWKEEIFYAKPESKKDYVKLLFKYHIDIFGLIPQGLAVSKIEDQK